jgi:hypothetical protein
MTSLPIAEYNSPDDSGFADAEARVKIQAPCDGPWRCAVRLAGAGVVFDAPLKESDGF